MAHHCEGSHLFMNPLAVMRLADVLKDGGVRRLKVRKALHPVSVSVISDNRGICHVGMEKNTKKKKKNTQGSKNFKWV